MNIVNRLNNAIISIIGRPSGGYITQAERELAKKKNRKKKKK